MCHANRTSSTKPRSAATANTASVRSCHHDSIVTWWKWAMLAPQGQKPWARRHPLAGRDRVSLTCPPVECGRSRTRKDCSGRGRCARPAEPPCRRTTARPWHRRSSEGGRQGAGSCSSARASAGQEGSDRWARFASCPQADQPNAGTAAMRLGCPVHPHPLVPLPGPSSHCSPLVRIASIVG